MTQPIPYNRVFNFANYQAANPTAPLPGGPVDEELSRIKVVIDQIRGNLRLIQRDDTALANASVGVDQLKSEVFIGVNPPAPWATERNYVARDTVFINSNFYLCSTSHISGVFATDLAAGKWSLIASFEAATSANAVNYDDSTSGLGATLVQGAIEALKTELDAIEASVAGMIAALDANNLPITTTGMANTDADDVQEAVSDLDTAISGKAAAAHTHAISAVTGLQTALDDKAPTARTISAAGLATGGGSLAANRTITVSAASNAETIAGTITNKATTPAGVKAARDEATSADGVGSPVFAYSTLGATAYGVTRAGSTLRSVQNSTLESATDLGLTGTWRCMGDSSDASRDGAVLWVKIS